MVVLDKDTQNRLKEIQLDILKEYIKICSKYNLRYYFMGGSCLGAVRHKGFIPWDDDIDVGMPRPDYEKFMRVAQSELPKHYFLQNEKTDPDYPSCFAKIRNSNTTFIESSVAHLNMNHGVYFDIFPIDGWCTKPLFKLRKKIYTICVQKIYKVSSKRRFLSNLVIKLISLIIPDYRKARDKLNKLVSNCKYDEYEMVANYFGAWGERETFLREKCFCDGSIGEFEGINVVLPKDPDYYCTRLYGDYMQLPPVEKRITHHYCDVIDLDNSYTKYI